MVRRRGPFFFARRVRRREPFFSRGGVRLFAVGRRLVLAAVLVVAAAQRPARAEWQVHRGGSKALMGPAERALQEDPDDGALAHRVVQLAGRRGAAALRERFRARAATAPGYGSLAGYAQVLLALGDGREAAEAFAAALGYEPDSLAALSGRARALASTGAASEAVAAYDQALGHERHPSARRRLIEAELAILASSTQREARPGGGEVERVLALRRELARLAPDSDHDAERLADALEAAGRPAEAAQTLERRAPPARAATKLALALRAARLRLADGDPADAARAAANLAASIRALGARPFEARRSAWAAAREVARQRGTLGDLVKELERAPGPVEWEVLGQVRDELGDLEGALAATRTALDRAPRDAAIGRRLIALYERLGRDEDATATYAELSRRIPDDVGFSTALANRQLRAGNHAGAGATLDRAVVRFARQPAALRELAESAARAGDDRRALAVWRRLAKLDPASEVAIIGLGEAQFQSGRKDDARRTWQALRRRAGSSESGHLRLGEVLLDHDLLSNAIEEAQSALRDDGKSPAPHRLLAQSYERQRKPDAALDEWREVVALASRHWNDAADAGLRREGRTHLLALLDRQGRGRLDAEVHRLREEAEAHPEDAEAALFLAEAQQRLGDIEGALTTLRAIAASAGSDSAEARDAAIEAGFALAHLLKRTGRLDEAGARLEELGRRAPGRAREADLQIADLALARYDAPGALASAQAAEAGADPATLLRIAELRERAGADRLAAATYRTAMNENAPSTAALSLAQLLTRQGDGQAAAATLETLLRTSSDAAAVTDAARRALDIDEYLGRLPELAESLSSPIADGQDSAARRRSLVGVLKRMLPTLYRDPGADDLRTRLGRRVLRPLLELVTGAEEAPDVAAIDLLGMLGDPDAAPALAQIAAQGQAARSSRPVDTGAAAQAQLAAIVALGRLADPRGRSALEHATAAGSTSTRAAALWSLGRISGTAVEPTLLRALEDPRPEIQAAASLGLGRFAAARDGGRDGPADADREDPTLRRLARVASDPARPLPARAAAIAGLGRPGRLASTGTLTELLDAGDPALSRAAAFALARARDPRALPILLARALLPERFALADADAPIAALGVWLAAGPLPDEARFVTSNEINFDEVLEAFMQPAAPGDLTPLWRGQTRALEDVLTEALSLGGRPRRAALIALDARPDGPGLGALAPAGSGPLSQDAALALREIVLPLADPIAALLDDPEVAVRAAALRILAKLDDDRVTPARLADAARDGSTALAGAASMGARLRARTRPLLGSTIAAAISPLLSDDGAPGAWRRRYAAVEVLAAVGSPGRAELQRAARDPDAVVRQAARDALGQLTEPR
jgi:predicted Zn-dependent protease